MKSLEEFIQKVESKDLISNFEEIITNFTLSSETALNIGYKTMSKYEQHKLKFPIYFNDKTIEQLGDFFTYQYLIFNLLHPSNQVDIIVHLKKNMEGKKYDI